MSINDWKTAVCDTREAYEYHCDISFSQESDASTNLIAALEGLCSAYDVEQTKRLVEDGRLSTQDQWQPIETLPNNSSDQVIAWPVLQFRDHERTQVASCSVDFARMSGATHWMPLPAAPKDST
jgi:hypothetical protein